MKGFCFLRKIITFKLILFIGFNFKVFCFPRVGSPEEMKCPLATFIIYSRLQGALPQNKSRFLNNIWRW